LVLLPFDDAGASTHSADRVGPVIGAIGELLRTDGSFPTARQRPLGHAKCHTAGSAVVSNGVSNHHEIADG